jgi:ubiquinone/menaquinone biosynthesis C-methylase UbiE
VARYTDGGHRTARDLAARLERRAKAEDEVTARDAYLGLLNISAGQRVLDVGCGSGAVTREIARRVGRAGLAVGLDPSPALLAVARELAMRPAWAIAWSFAKAMRFDYLSPTGHLTPRCV